MSQVSYHENETICYKGGKSYCRECYQQEEDILAKHLGSFIEGDLGDGKDAYHVTLVKDDGEHIINKSLLHLVHLKV